VKEKKRNEEEKDKIERRKKPKKKKAEHMVIRRSFPFEPLSTRLLLAWPTQKQN